MKSFYTKLALFLLPIALYFTVFICFEPYNYFGLRQSATESDQVIYRVREFVKKPENAVILGDSRMAHLDMGLVSEITGRQFSNLAFGGAAEKEMIDLFYFAVEQNPDIDTVYLEVSFYTMNAKYDKDRVSNIKTIVTNPLAYMCNFDYNIEMLNRIRYVLKGEYLGPEMETATYTEADYLDENGKPLAYRKQLLAYNENIAPVCKDYSINTEQLARLVEVAEYCNNNGIKLYFVLPPMADSVYNEIVVPNGIDKDLNTIVSTLRATGAVVLDYEYTNRDIGLSERQFFDGFHVDTEYGLPQFTEFLFSQEG